MTASFVARAPRGSALDLAIALGLTASVIALAGGSRSGVAVTVALVTLPVAIRRRWPLALLAVAGAGIVITSGAGGVSAAAAFAMFAFSAGEEPARPSWSLPAAVLITLPMAAALVGLEAEAWAVVAPICLALAGWLAGDAVRGRRIAAGLRQEAADRRERERETELRETLAEERRRMARELHDIVAHSVSVMVVQAGAARTVMAEQPELAAASIGAIETTGREAMAELRRLLGVLANDGDTAGLAPASRLAQVPELVERVAEAGLPVELRVAGTSRAVPPAIDLAAYRIVQEGLTNALRHSGRARTLVNVEFRAGELKIEVLDEGPGRSPGAGGPAAGSVEGRRSPGGSDPAGTRSEVAPSPGGPAGSRSEFAPGEAARSGGGRGLAGLRARAEQLGGTLEVGPRLGGGFAVRAWLPLEPAA